MNSLQGLPERVAVTGKGGYTEPGQSLLSRMPKRNRGLILVVCILLIVTVAYVTEIILTSRGVLDASSEPFEREGGWEKSNADGCDNSVENCDDSADKGIDNSLNENQESKPISEQAAIVDEKDVFCEDLSQYEKWHEAKVTKGDGVMYTVVKQYKHDKTSFTYVSAPY